MRRGPHDAVVGRVNAWARLARPERTTTERREGISGT